MDAFNKHFTSFSSEKNVTDVDCVKFALNNFMSKFSNLNAKFSFVDVGQNEVVDALNSIDEKSSPGVSELSTSILKGTSKTISKFLTKLFNDCIKNGQ